MRNEPEFVEASTVIAESISDKTVILDDADLARVGGGLQEDLPGPSKLQEDLPGPSK